MFVRRRLRLCSRCLRLRGMFVLSARFSYLSSSDVAHKICRSNRYIPSGQVSTPGPTFIIFTSPYPFHSCRLYKLLPHRRHSVPLTPGFLLYCARSMVFCELRNGEQDSWTSGWNCNLGIIMFFWISVEKYKSGNQAVIFCMSSETCIRSLAESYHWWCVARF
jgi:hypothetical protein